MISFVPEEYPMLNLNFHNIPHRQRGDELKRMVFCICMQLGASGGQPEEEL